MLAGIKGTVVEFSDLRYGRFEGKNDRISADRRPLGGELLKGLAVLRLPATGRSLFLFWLVAVTALVALTNTGLAQSPMAFSEELEAEAVNLPENLTPDVIDSVLSRLTDAEVRVILREELERKAEEQALASETTEAFLSVAEQRLTSMYDTIAERLVRWADRIANLDQRKDQVQRLLDRAQSGVIGMVLSALVVVATGVLAAMAMNWLTQSARLWMQNAQDVGYWGRVLRTFGLGALEAIPIFAFAFATKLIIPMLREVLGPLTGMGWIYTAGVTWSWGAILISRRAFAPYVPQVRITALDDVAAVNIHKVLRRCVQIGVCGWLIAGFFLLSDLAFRLHWLQWPFPVLGSLSICW